MRVSLDVIVAHDAGSHADAGCVRGGGLHAHHGGGRAGTIVAIGRDRHGPEESFQDAGVPVMALHQLNRSTNTFGRETRRPTIFDIRASGEIAETANTVIAIYRSEVARPDFIPLLGTAEALILKQRQGRRDVRAWMKSRLSHMRLESCEAPEGYDDAITKDTEPAGTTGGNGKNGSRPGIGARTQSARVSQARWNPLTWCARVLSGARLVAGIEDGARSGKVDDALRRSYARNNP